MALGEEKRKAQDEDVQKCLHKLLISIMIFKYKY